MNHNKIRDLKIKFEKASLARKLSAIATTSFLATSLFINFNMDDGEFFDAHQHVPEIVDRSMPYFVHESKEEVTAIVNELADQKEQQIRGITGISTAASFASFVFFSRRRKKYALELIDELSDGKGPGDEPKPKF